MENKSEFDINFNVSENRIENFNTKNSIISKSNISNESSTFSSTDKVYKQSKETLKDHVEHETPADDDPKYTKANALTTLIPKLEKLHLSGEEQSSDCDYSLFGYVKNVIASLCIAIVQAVDQEKLLDIGAAVFVKINDEKEHRHIGHITDVLGTVFKPMYAVSLSEWAYCHFLELESKVYFMYDHPSTKLIRVQRDGDRYSITEDPRRSIS